MRSVAQCCGIVAALLLCIALPARAQTLVKDINTLTSGPYPHDLVSTGTQAFFLTGSQLWVVDEAGLEMRSIKKTWPGDLRAMAPERWAAALNGKILFRLQGSRSQGMSSTYFEDLWISDGTTSGTFSLTEINSNYRIGDAITVGDHVYFLKQYRDGYYLTESELWVTDGTTDGTERLATFRGPVEGVVESLHLFNDQLWFVAKQVHNSHSPVLYDLIQFDMARRAINMIGFTTTKYMEITGASESKLFLFADADEAGLEPWAVDINTLSTFRLGDLFTSAYVSTTDLWGIATTDEYFLFKKATSQRTSDLFMSDGTPEGTRLLTGDMGGWDTWNYERKSGVIGNRVLFQAPGLDHDEHIWTTDGTPGGTAILTWPESGQPFSSTDGFTVFGQELLFPSYQPSTGYELWASDGSHAGPRLVADFRPGPDSGTFDDAVVTHSGILAPAIDLQGNPQLWFSHGIPGTERMILNISDYARNNSSNPELFHSFQNTVYFTAGTEAAGRELWSTDGTELNTSMVSSSAADGFSSNATAIGSIRDVLFIATDYGLYSKEFDSDDLQLLTTPENGPFRLPRTRASRMLFSDSLSLALFFAYNIDGFQELWESNGTKKGTRQISSFRMPPAHNDYLSRVFGVVGGQYIVQRYMPGGTRMFGIDPSTGVAEPLLPESIRPSGSPVLNVGNKFYLSSVDRGSRSLYKTDGTRDGTRLVELTGQPGLPDMISAVHSSDGGILMTGSTLEMGRELWITDGSPEGTRLLADICPGSCESGPRSFVNVGKYTFFEVYAQGDEHVWVTDGTPEGTDPVFTERTPPGERDVDLYRIFPADDGVLILTRIDKYEVWYADSTKDSGRLISTGFDDGYAFTDDFQWGAVLGDQFIFQADHPTYGNELFKLNLPNGGTSVATESTTPSEFAVASGYPNPFEQHLTVAFKNPYAMNVGFEVFDVLGRRVWKGETQRLPAGRHTQVLSLGPGVASGIYHIRIQQGTHVQTIKAIKID